MLTKEFKTFTLYALCDPETDQVYYIGQTTDPEKRLARHCYRPGDLLVGNPFLAEWLFRLSEKGLLPKMIILDTVIGSTLANQREEELIKKYWDAGQPVLNIHKSTSTIQERKDRLNF